MKERIKGTIAQLGVVEEIIGVVVENETEEERNVVSFD
jgi:hypothetical protein